MTIPPFLKVIRKRMSTPVTSPRALHLLEQLASDKSIGGTFTPPSADEACREEDRPALEAFYAHLQIMTGTVVDAAVKPQCFTAGLSALCSMWLALSKNGGAEIVMCSTAYGGSSQLTDLICERTPRTLRKHTFGIQGDADIIDAIKTSLEKLGRDAETVSRKTVLFVEVPTNPDMKVPDLDLLAEMITAYCSGRGVGLDNFLLLVDATFAPASKVMAQLQQKLRELPVITFISMSKSVSRGMTTAGAFVANQHPVASRLLADTGVIGSSLDTTFKVDQMEILLNNHVGVEDRCERAYQTACRLGATLQAAVKDRADGFDMRLNFVKAQHAALGFTSSTFSFNLPKPDGASDEETDAFAQRFVDALTTNAQFKPCVSFGQDNNLIYCTVPATSTQGAIKAEDKELQAVGGVQLVRLSFPPAVDEESAHEHMRSAVESVYGAFRSPVNN